MSVAAGELAGTGGRPADCAVMWAASCDHAFALAESPTSSALSADRLQVSINSDDPPILRLLYPTILLIVHIGVSHLIEWNVSYVLSIAIIM